MTTAGVSIGTRRVLFLLILAAAIVSGVGGNATAAARAGRVSLPESTFAAALTRGADGNVWFVAHNYLTLAGRVVGKISSDQKVTTYEVPDGYESLTAGPDGNVWFAEKDGIGRIGGDGKITSLALPAGAGMPFSLTAGPDGNVWFLTDKPYAVGRMNGGGEPTIFPLSSEVAPGSLTAGPDGDLWFTEPAAGRIDRIGVLGDVTDYSTPDGVQPRSIVAGPDGNLWFSDDSAPQIGKMTPSGEVTVFPVPTIDATTEVAVGSGGEIVYTAGDEIGAISTAGRISWPSCFTRSCEFPPVALLGSYGLPLQVASGEGHCPGYCGGGSELLYVFGHTEIGPYRLPNVPFGIGPRLAPVREGHTEITVGCGHRAACDGVLRLRALVKPRKSEFSTRLISRYRYSLAAGETMDVPLSLPLPRYEKIPHNRHFLIVDAIHDGTRVAKRGFDFSTERGGSAKHF